MNESEKKWTELYLEEVMSKFAKGVSIRPKSESKLMKLLNPFVSIFNKRFMTGYITTVGKTIWAPDDWIKDRTEIMKLRTICHEGKHIVQSVEQTNLLHGILYMFPQSLAVFSLLSILAFFYSTSWAWALLFLLFLAPLPAPFRYKKEMEAYRINVFFAKNVYKSNDAVVEIVKENVVKNLAKSFYYFCWPFPKKVRKDIDKDLDITNNEYNKEMVKFLMKHGLY